MKHSDIGTSPVVQWLRLHLAMQGTEVWTSGRGTKIPHAMEQLSPQLQQPSLHATSRVLAPQQKILHDTREILSAASKTQGSCPKKENE